MVAKEKLFVHTKAEIKQKISNLIYQPSYLVNVFNAFWHKGTIFSKHECFLHFIGLSSSIKVLLRINLIIYHAGVLPLVICMVIYFIKSLPQFQEWMEREV